MIGRDLTVTELLVGTGGIGWGVIFALLGDHPLGREESRAGLLRQGRDYCKLHIISHYFTALLPPGRNMCVLPVGKVGDDESGRRLTGEMAAVGMDLRYVHRIAEAPTLFSVCLLYPDTAGGNITAANSASSLVGPGDIDLAVPEMASHRGRGMALAAPEVPLAARARLLARAGEFGFFRAASFTTAEMAEVLRANLLADVDLLATNIDEAAALAGLGPALDAEEILAACANTAYRFNPGIMLCVTAGHSGSWGFHLGDWEYIPALDADAVSTAGAGDAYLAAVLAALIQGADFIRHPGRQRGTLTEGAVSTACDYGALVAGISVTSPHTIHPDLDAGMVRAYCEAHGLKLAFLHRS